MYQRRTITWVLQFK